MPFAASHSREPDARKAVESLTRDVVDQLGDLSPELSFLFVSHDHQDAFPTLAEQVASGLGGGVLLGCTSEAVVEGAAEFESGPAMAVWSALLPGCEIEPFHAEFARTADGIVSTGLPGGAAENCRAIFLLGEPFSSAPKSLIERFAEGYPGIPLIGGMASGGTQPGENKLFFNSELVESGAVGAVLRGGPRVRAVVSQGCRPIGTHFVITKAQENIVLELGGVPPLKQLEELLPALSERDRDLIRQGVHLGLVMNEYQDKFERGDFLISNVIGADPKIGAIAVSNPVRIGQTVQFHVRDAETADEDLVEMLQHDRDAHENEPQAALLFSCNGRGTRLFPDPHHDASTIQKLIGPVPLSGFFAQGELGPVSGRNHMHGFTASVALFE